MALFVLISVLVLAAAPATSPGDAARLVETALARQGGPDAYEPAGGITIEMTGEYDLAARHQGRTRAPDLAPVHETLAIDLSGARVGYELDWYNYALSRQHLREIHIQDGPVLYADLRNGFAGWGGRPGGADTAQRLRRIDPRFLLAEAAERGVAPDRVDPNAVRFTGAGGEEIRLVFDERTGFLVRAEHAFTMPVDGDALMGWTWSGYQADQDGAVPARLAVTLNGRVLKEAALAWRPGADPALFQPPGEIEFPAPPEPDPAAESDFVPYGEREPVVETIAPQVHLVRNLRPGFHVLFVEFDSFVVLIDAPTLWHEMQYLPPLSGSPGDDVHALGSKLLQAIEQTAPGKPVRHLVLTHHHSDHIGGTRPLMAGGATVLAGPPAAEAARTIAEAEYTLQPFPLTTTPGIEIVDEVRTIAEGDMAIELIPLPNGNPKAEGFLVVYLPRERLVYTTAFLYPVPERVFPLVESVPLSSWFVEWLDNSGLEPEQVWNLHGTGRVQDWQLDYFRRLEDRTQNQALPGAGSDPG